MDTTSLGFQKPKEEEYYDINIFNKNTQLANDLIEKNSSAIGQKLDKNSSFYTDLEAYYGNTKLIDAFQDTSKWNQGIGDTTNVKIGSQSLKIIETHNLAGYSFAKLNGISLDLTKLNNGEESTDNDYICLVCYISDVKKVAEGGISFTFDQMTPANEINVKIGNITSGLSTGWNFIKIKKSDFITSGTGKWSDIKSVQIRWYSTANAQNAYVSFQLIQLVKADPVSLIEKPNPFQKFGVRDVEILNGEWFVGKEFGELCIKELGSSEPTKVKSLIGQKLFGDCNVNFKVKRLGVNGVSWFGLLSSNDIGVYVITYQNSLEFKVVRENQDVIENTVDFASNIGDVLIFNIQRVGNKFKVIAHNLTTGIQAESNLEYQLDKVALCIGRSQGINYWNNLLSVSITEISHTHHSDIAEVAKRLLVHPYSNPNLLINGDFQIWQRGTSFVNPNVYGIYTADRWNSTVDQTTGSTMTVSKGVNSNGEVYMHITGNNKSPANMMLYQVFTKEEFPNISNQLVTVTFDIETNIDLVNDFAQFPNGALGVYKNFIIKSGRRKVSVSMKLVDFSNTRCGIQFLRIMTLADNIDIKLYSVKMELGEIATPLSPRSYGEELALCQRYYENMVVRPVYYSVGAGAGYQTEFPIAIVEKRVVPTVNYTLISGSGSNILNYYAQARNSKLIEVGLKSNVVGHVYGQIYIVLDAEIY